MSYFSNECLNKDHDRYTLWLVLENEELKKNPYFSFKEKLFPENANAGFDLISTDSSFEKSVGHRSLYLSDLGVRAVMTRGDVLHPDATVHYRLAPRSSIYKTGFMMANSRGIIDRTYRGQLMAPMVSVGSLLTSVEKGTRLFQIIAPALGHIKEVVYVDSLPETARGEGGFGSTGTK